MTETKFTAGPWERGTMQVQCTAVFRPCVGTADGKLICACADNTDKAKANADLIAAAPEMYELLDRIRGRLESCKLEQSIDVETEREIRQLLAKARGEEGK